jgi:hypothetical protein
MVATWIDLKPLKADVAIAQGKAPISHVSGCRRRRTASTVIRSIFVVTNTPYGHHEPGRGERLPR